jgi:hypothetical protein
MHEGADECLELVPQRRFQSSVGDQTIFKFSDPKGGHYRRLLDENQY